MNLLTAVLDDRQALDAALDAGGVDGLEPRDRAFARALTGTAFRRLGEIDRAIGLLVARQPSETRFLRILQVAAAQILFMGTADHAAVSVAVDMVGRDRRLSRYRGLANAVLRRLARDKEAFRSDDPARDNTPDWLWHRWCGAYGEASTRAIAAAHLLEPYLDLTPRGAPEAVADDVGGHLIAGGSVRLIPDGPVGSLPGFEEGRWWVQDAAAAVPARLLGNVDGQRVADLCAAPGGKTAQLAAAGAKVTAVDISPGRIKRLAANLRRLDLHAEVVAADILEWRPDVRFDAVLLDAPCSSTGTIRRHPDIARLKRETDIGPLADLQGRMIARAAGLLAPGGTLVMCTCSLEPEEGERHHAALGTELGLVPAPIAPHEVPGLEAAVTPEGTVRTLPLHLPAASDAPLRFGGLDGFFVMRFLKER